MSLLCGGTGGACAFGERAAGPVQSAYACQLRRDAPPAVLPLVHSANAHNRPPAAQPSPPRAPAGSGHARSATAGRARGARGPGAGCGRQHLRGHCTPPSPPVVRHHLLPAGYGDSTNLPADRRLVLDNIEAASCAYLQQAGGPACPGDGACRARRARACLAPQLAGALHLVRCHTPALPALLPTPRRSRTRSGAPPCTLCVTRGWTSASTSFRPTACARSAAGAGRSGGGRGLARGATGAWSTGAWAAGGTACMLPARTRCVQCSARTAHSSCSSPVSWADLQRRPCAGAVVLRRFMAALQAARHTGVSEERRTPTS